MGTADPVVSGSGNYNEGFELEDGGRYRHNGLNKDKGVTLDNLNDIRTEEEDIQCGFAFCRPAWLQRFANKASFMIVFSLLAVVQSMGWSYMTGTITTIQKRFKISSQTTGIVIAGNEVSQIIFSVILGYYGGKGHRPRWIAVGVLFSAAACFLLAFPHLLYGAGEDALSLTEEYASSQEVPTRQISQLVNVTGSSKRGKVELCVSTKREPKSDCSVGDASIVPLLFIFIAQFVAGVGVLLFFSLGGPYLDDNVKKSNSPMLFGITSSLRLIGPTLGFLLASACLKVFISPTLTPYITTEDPRWMGAWWLGWILLGILMAIIAILISLFPKKLPKAAEREKRAATDGKIVNDTKVNLPSGRDTEEDTTELVEKHGFQDLAKDIKSLVQNRINLYNNIAGIFYIFPAVGYWTYMPKYLENIFMQTAVQASVISGIVGIATQSVGLLGSGWIISKFQPSARKLAGWNVMVGLIYVGVKISFTQMGCANEKFDFLSDSPYSISLNLTSSCNANCNCLTNKFAPVCDPATNQLFYSACHAGCSSFVNGVISNCSCLSSSAATVKLGTCNEGCFTTFLVFLGMNALVKLIDGSGRIGNLLVSYRCVHPKDKALSIALTIGAFSAFALLPGPILFGYIFDMSCIVWGTKCGGKGNCWLYNGEQLRYVFNLTAAAFIFMGAVFDCLVWYHVKELDLYDESKNIERWRQQEESKNKKTAKQSGTM